MSNKKRIFKRINSRTGTYNKTDIEKFVVAFGKMAKALSLVANEMNKIRLENQAKKVVKFPSGGWTPAIGEIQKRKINLELDFAEGWKKYLEEDPPEIKSSLLQYLNGNLGWSDDDFKRQYFGNPNPASDQRERSGKK